MECLKEGLKMGDFHADIWLYDTSGVSGDPWKRLRRGDEMGREKMIRACRRGQRQRQEEGRRQGEERKHEK